MGVFILNAEHLDLTSNKDVELVTIVTLMEHELTLGLVFVP